MPASKTCAHATQTLRQTGASGRTAVRTARILLVEDEPVTAEVFSRALRRSGHEVRVAKDGLAAMAALRDASWDLVVLDLGLPTLPGIEVLRRLRGSDLTNLPVVVMSGHGPAWLPAAASLLAPGTWLEKPLRPRDLEQAIGALLEAKAR